MSLNQWNIEKIRQYEQETGQALLRDEQTLASFSHDFGNVFHSTPTAVFIPDSSDELQSFIRFANQHVVPVTVRGNGLSQCGQSLSVAGGVVVSMQNFSKALEYEGETIWVEANSSWSNLLDASLPHHKAPFVLPYNCNLSVGGVLSAGGVGASSFKFGAINAHVQALEIIDGAGVKHLVDNTSPLFHACLSGQGRFGIITKTCIKLKSVKSQVKTVCLVYADQKQWFTDIEKAKEKCDYMELFCSPSIQGAQLKEGKRVPMTQWLYGMHLSVDFEKNSPDPRELIAHLKPWNIINVQEEPISSFLLRHNSRFEAMKMLGQWDLFHPWYECFIGRDVLQEHLPHILKELPVYYANLVHIVPMEKMKAGFLMLPEDDSVCSFMILNPGVPAPYKDGVLQAIKSLDECLINLGGKRYLSGYLGEDLSDGYWKNHFVDQYQSWIDLKTQFDPLGIFKSVLHTA
ncbi:FAD-binding protein [uncultured Legionella sp.]|uniref:FAD-binding protein n=1 Tax=uncultured Legionella sp. TaxID=210934 RepID=UPI0026056B8A|nr:FAD-binding protein [uncultured Legionella sp.]